MIAWRSLWPAVVLLCACSAPPSPVPPLSAAPSAAPPPPADREGSTGGVERREIDGETFEVVTATAEAASYDDARNRAINAARAALLALQRQTIRQELRDFIREETEVQDNQRRLRYREEVESVLVARTEGDLQRCRVLDATAASLGTGFRGRATVACPERVLFPTRRLQALVLRNDVAPAAFVELADLYESEGQVMLAEQALRWGYDRGGGAATALALAKHFGRRALDADALRWCDVAARDAAGTPIAAEASTRAAELRQRVETAERLVAQLLQVAETKQDRARFRAYVLERTPTAAEVEWDVRWTLRGDLDRRVLKMWLDDSLTPAWWAEDESDEPRPSARDGGVRFALPRDSKPARALFWSLPLDSELWPRLVAWKNVEFVLADADVQQRLQLRDLVVALRNSSAVASVVPIE
jgi:hypothetical protein